MSSAANLLDINVDELFETYSVAEIDAIHKKLQTDVEHKKEELRTMVGERYRDLLQAADTIGEMRQTSGATIEHIVAITATCRRLNEQQLIGFRTAGTPTLPASASAAAASVRQAPPATAAERSVRQFHGLGVQIKLLATLPELIWSHCDRGDYFVATQLFTLSRHISTGLQLDVHRPQMRLFPVAKHLWSTLAPFYHTIRQRCLATLQRRELSAEVAARCLASIVLLENCSADKLLATLIQLRGKAFRATLAEEGDEQEEREGQDAQAEGTGGGRRIRDRVLASLRVLQSTVHLLHECFVVGTVRGLVDGLRDERAEPTLALVQAAGGWAADGGWVAVAGKVPDIVAGFRPRCQLSALQPDALRSQCANWLQTTATDCRRQIQSVINGIASVATIQTIRQQSLALAKPNDWAAILASLHLPADLDLYTYYYEPLIQERIQQIIAGCWAQIIRNTRSQVEQLVQQENRTDAEAKTAAKWTPCAADIPLSLQQALSTDKHRHLLALKASGYTETVVAICAALDQQLATVCDELSSYLGAAETGDAIRLYLQEASRQALVDLIEAIRQIGGHRSRSACVALATVLRGLAELCPNLKRCLQRPAASQQQPSEWQHVCSLLSDESFRLWSQWLTLFVAEQTAQFPIAERLDYGQVAADMLSWERHTVQEKDENDAPVESAIRVPAHLSVGLQQFWHRVCVQLEATLVAYSLPRRVTVALGDRLTEHLLEVYERRATDELVAGNQTLALQAYFDVRFVQLVFVGRQEGGAGGSERRERGQMAERWQQLAAVLKAAVDPFDFELFHRYLVANVKRTVQRMQHKLGVLIANPDQLASILSAAAPAAAHDKEPNVLALSVERNEAAGYFALLPVINAPLKTHSAPAEPSKVKAKRAKTQPASGGAEPATGGGPSAADERRLATRGGGGQQEQQLQQQQQANLANVKSGAAAFFGAMSKDWFQ